jgi:SAM-dependent methyltransferase
VAGPGDGVREAARAAAARRRRDAYVDFFAPVTNRFLPTVAARLAPGAGAVVDLGSGPGELAALIRDTGRPVVAVDRSGLMAAASRDRGIPSVVADAERLPFRSGAFAAVVAAFLLPHVPNLDAALREAARVLRPGGVMVQLGWAEPAQSPFTGLASTILARHASPEVGRALAAAESRTRSDTLVTAARGAGLAQVEVETLRVRTRVPGPHEWWKGMLGASTGLADLLRLSGVEQRRAVETEFLAEAAVLADGDGLAVPVAARLLTAVRPAPYEVG